MPGVILQLHEKLLRDAHGLTDGQLLDYFVAAGQELPSPTASRCGPPENARRTAKRRCSTLTETHVVQRSSAKVKKKTRMKTMTTRQ
jgi:hypothetical protein